MKNEHNNHVLRLFVLTFILSFSFLFTPFKADSNLDDLSVDDGTHYYIEEPDMGGYAHRYYGGTFSISTEIGDPLMGVCHYVLCTSNRVPMATRVTLYSSNFYPTYCSYPTISDEYINLSNYSAWVEAKTNYFGPASYLYSTYYGTHRFTCNNDTFEF